MPTSTIVLMRAARIVEGERQYRGEPGHDRRIRDGSSRKRTERIFGAIRRQQH
jgi:hypothetical protein